MGKAENHIQYIESELEKLEKENSDLLSKNKSLNETIEQE